VVSGGGALFPALSNPNQAFVCTLFKNGSPNITEMLLVTGRSGDNFTGLARNINGTGALAWNAGDTVAMVPTAEALNFFAQLIDLQAQAGNWALDVGAANAYVVHLTPALNASTIGMPIRWFAAHTNTGASTFNDGITQAPLVAADGQPLQALDVIGGSFYESVWNGAVFFLCNVRDVGFAQVRGTIANGQVPQSAVTQYQAALAIAFSQLTGQLQNGQIASSIALPGSPTTTTQALGDASTKIPTTAFVNPGSSFGTSNYRKNPDGSIHQWGRATISSSTLVSFPTTFPTACRSVVVTAINSTNQFNLAAAANQSNFTVQNGSGDVYWQADGN
jgi:hypothetical protein